MSTNKLVAIAVKIAVVVAVLAVLSGGCGGPAADVDVEKVGPRSIEEVVTVAGSLQASSPTQVIPQVYGSVAAVFVQDGQEVAAGQTLVQLDTSDLDQALLAARASLESTQSLASMFNSLSSSAGSIGSSANAALASVDAGVAGLYEIEKALIPVLPEEYRLAALQAVENSYAGYQTSVASRPPVSTGGGGGVSTGAQQAAANKSIENAEKNLEAATIAAPVAGTLVSVTNGGASLESMMGTMMSSFSSMMPSGLDISSLSGLSSSMSGMGMASGGPLVPGSYIMPGTPIYTIVNLKSMSIIAKVDEADIASIDEGQAATISLEAYPDDDITGTVTHVADTATTNEAGATAFDVTIQMEPTEFNLKIGMTGTANVVVASKKAATVVPVEALVEKDGNNFVFKVVDGKARLTEVKIGLVTEDKVEIVEGVVTGDTVVFKGVEKLKDGQKVKPKS
ncbi:MAG: efflux RND transporter periplasmic adaptor subunit [Actinobacteria bacterium]|nr:efflux RND transporter periplasmic adaptor subunit [Actinomycetota bacterium]MCG2817705.1 efflux RND transporter periplasmic adaptor subunit [Actinomycetes bacterium]MBU4179028.1 efflux RND transporter periplasmic adaptor subunit [Actinomycetota bacterium]MBU4217497.1 efflux RND transporter periplasmic adaptor subunit [Actinomycetota bacterium]MBU4358202.1 efflux RND transporter periplasmic adaptor subunit [Actinomycetota bacterium]